MRSKPLIIALTCIVFACTTSTYAETEAMPKPVAKVVWVKGNLKALMPNKEERNLQKGSIIYLKDTLLTDTGSQAQIVFTDNSLLTFKPNSKFIIEQYNYEPSAKKKSVGRYVMNLLTGGFRTITGLIAKKNPNDYQINTPVATIGVRGTDFAVVLKGGQLLMAQFAGSPCMNSEKGGQLCLTAAVPYGMVPAFGASPVKLTQPPAELLVKDPITEVKTPPRFETPASAAPAPRPATGVAPRSSGGVISNFCISQ